MHVIKPGLLPMYYISQSLLIYTIEYGIACIRLSKRMVSKISLILNRVRCFLNVFHIFLFWAFIFHIFICFFNHLICLPCP